jgi:hypothetical protein
VTGHLIHIGYPKTGSNFLRRWFAAHPRLAYCDGGIAGFANVYDIARQGAGPPTGILYRITSAEGLATPHADVGRDRVDYERMRSGAMAEAQARVCETLAALFPNAHVLIVTRGFRSMIVSAYSQYVRTGGEQPLDGFCRAAPGESDRHSWDYDRIVRLYRAAFDGRVIVLPYELLRDSPSRFTGALCKQLDMPPFDPPAERSNPAIGPVELAWYPRLTRFVRSLPVGGPLRRRIEAHYLARARDDRLSGLVSRLQRWRPKEPVTGALLGDDFVRSVAGTTETLREDPLYAAYAGEYFLR